MQTSELIKALADAIGKYGDLPVGLNTGYCDVWCDGIEIAVRLGDANVYRDSIPLGKTVKNFIAAAADKDAEDEAEYEQLLCDCVREVNRVHKKLRRAVREGKVADTAAIRDIEGDLSDIIFKYEDL